MSTEIVRHRRSPKYRPIAIAQEVGPKTRLQGQLGARLRVRFKVTRVSMEKMRYTVWERVLKIVG